VSLRLKRLLDLDELLRSDLRRTQGSLAQALEVSERNIRSDLDFLRDRFHAPLDYQKDKGWHYTEPNWRLPSISLSQGELFALTLGARMLEAYAQSAYVKELRSGIERLVERLPDGTWVNLQQLVNEQVLFRAGAEIDLNPQIWRDLELACRQKRRMNIEYYTAGRNALSQRKLDPLFESVVGILHSKSKNMTMVR
jgi:predicted DNA-binding transcriptional regulator YafY